MKAATENGANIPFPPSALFNAIRDDDFIVTIRNLVHGIGCGFDEVTCTFPSELDLGDKPFQGVAFWVYSFDEAIVDQATFMIYVRRSCDNYLRKHPEDEEILRAILENADLSASQVMNDYQ